MKTLLLATHNKAKLEELTLGVRELKEKGIRIVSLDNLAITQNPEETGKTFKENALIKARFYADLTSLPTIADDGGLMIPFLNNAPGVQSRRWLGRDASDEELINHALLHLRGVRKNDRIAYLSTCLCFFHPETKTILFEQNQIKGYIAEKPSGRATNGYPFRALFIVETHDKYYDELTEEENHVINHRLIALKKLIRKINI